MGVTMNSEMLHHELESGVSSKCRGQVQKCSVFLNVYACLHSAIYPAESLQQLCFSSSEHPPGIPDSAALALYLFGPQEVVILPLTMA
jgi:hypothetical protein